MPELIINKHKNSYKKENDVSVLSLSTDEILIINPKIIHTRIIDSEGEHRGPDEIVIKFSAAEPCPVEDREPFTFDPNEPLIIGIDRKDTLDHLIATLQTLRDQIWGYDFDINNN